VHFLASLPTESRNRFEKSCLSRNCFNEFIDTRTASSLASIHIYCVEGSFAIDGGCIGTAGASESQSRCPDQASSVWSGGVQKGDGAGVQRHYKTPVNSTTQRYVTVYSNTLSSIFTLHISSVTYPIRYLLIVVIGPPRFLSQLTPPTEQIF
jgi:hypothetical protein